jgi:hypothetical protein
VTGAELYFSGANWAFQAKLMDPARRGAYTGVGEVFTTLGERWAPAVYTLLVLSWRPSGLSSAGWLVIAAIALVATVGLHPSVRMAERFLEREGLGEGEGKGRGVVDDPDADVASSHGPSGEIG